VDDGAHGGVAALAARASDANTIFRGMSPRPRPEYNARAAIIRLHCRGGVVRALLFFPLYLAAVAALSPASFALRAADSAVVVSPAGVAPLERLAAAEVRRYVYARTGTLLPLAPALPDGGDAIVIAAKNRAAVASLYAGAADLKPQEFALEPLAKDGRAILVIAGGDAAGTLYGAPWRHHSGREDPFRAPGRPRESAAALRAAGHPALPRFPRGARLVEPRRIQGRPRPASQARHELLRAARLPRGRRRPRAPGVDRHGRGREPRRDGAFQLPRAPLHHRQRHVGLQRQEH